MRTRHYRLHSRLYGMHLLIEWQSASLSPTTLPRENPSGTPDVRVVESGEPLGPGEPSFRAASMYGAIDQGDLYFAWRNIAESRVSNDGRRVDVRLLAEDAGTTFWNYLFNQVMSASIIRLGREPIHATTVCINGRAIALTGASGTGKSTLAAAFIVAGHKLCTDDLLVIRRSEDEYLAEPAMPRIKLYPRSANALFPGRQAAGRVHSTTPKLVFGLADEEFASEPAPLDSVYILRNGASNAITIRKISPKSGFAFLVSNAFNRLDLSVERMSTQIAELASLVDAVPIRSVTCPKRIKRLPAVVEAIRRDVASRHGEDL